MLIEVNKAQTHKIAGDMVIKISNSQLSNTISSRMGTLLKCGLNIGVKKIAKNPDRIQFNIAKIS